MPAPPKKPISERNAHLFVLATLVIGLIGVALLEFTDRPRDPLAGWYLLIWPFMVVSGGLAYTVSGDPEADGFVRRGVLLIIGLQLVLAALQGLMYVLPDPAYDTWLATRTDTDEPHGVETWIVAVAHVVGFVFAPVIGFLLRTIRRVWALAPQDAAPD